MSDLLERYSETYTVTRPAGELVKGLWKENPDDDVEFDIRASIQPARGMTLLLLPEGQRTQETVKIYTGTDLQLADQAAKRKGDRLTYRGRVFEVQFREDWSGTNISHYKFLAQLVEADT